MWNILGQGLAGQVVPQLAGSLGLGASAGVAIESIVLANKYAIIPGFEKADIAITRKIWGEEAALKTEQDWLEVRQKYLDPVINYADWFGNILKEEIRESHGDSKEDKKKEDLVENPVSKEMQKYGGRDVSKVGVAGSQAKKITDDTDIVKTRRPPSPSFPNPSKEGIDKYKQIEQQELIMSRLRDD